MMDTLKQLWDMALSVWNAVNLPAGVAMLLSIGITQWVKAAATGSTGKDLPGWAVRPLSFFLTVFMFLTYCWIVRIPIRDQITLGNAIIAGMCGPALIWALKKYTPVDLDKMFASKDDSNGPG